MKLFLQHGLLTIICTFLSFSAQAQSTIGSKSCEVRTLSYKVYQGKQCIGFLNLKKITKDSLVHYSYDLQVKIKVVFSFLLNQNIQETYVKGVLTESIALRKLDGKIKLYNTVQWKEGGYQMGGKDMKSSVFKGDITASLVSMYFTAPIRLNKVLAESFLEMADVKTIKPDAYLVSCVNGNKTTYTYSKGVCSTLNATGSWGIEMRCELVNDTVMVCK